MLQMNESQEFIVIYNLGKVFMGASTFFEILLFISFKPKRLKKKNENNLQKCGKE